jgi:hypothetical protein
VKEHNMSNQSPISILVNFRLEERQVRGEMEDGLGILSYKPNPKDKNFHHL